MTGLSVKKVGVYVHVYKKDEGLHIRKFQLHQLKKCLSELLTVVGAGGWVQNTAECK